MEVCRRCNRNQYECRTSGECIAIYNACDGIPQCVDGSDESPELNCPGTGTTPRPAVLVTEQLKTYPETVNQPPMHVFPEQQQHQQAESPQHPYTQQQYQQQLQGWHQQEQHYPLQQQQASKEEPMPQQPQHYYGREGEVVYNGHPDMEQPWASYQGSYHSNPVNNDEYDDQNSHIFNHKGNGLVANSDSVQPYGEGTQSKTYYGNNYYNAPYKQNSQENWSGQHQKQAHNLGHPGKMADTAYHGMRMQLPSDPDVPSEQQHGPYISQGTSDYYYDDHSQEEGYHSGGRIPLHELHHALEHDPAFKAEMHEKNVDLQNKPHHHKSQHHKAEKEETKASVKKEQAEKVEESHVKKEEVPISSTTETATAQASVRKHMNPAPHHMKVSSLEANRDTVSLSEVEGQTAKPGGAILALVLGLSVSAVLAVIVGCRLRVVRRRMRRGGRSPYAHDADYLVNGMYL